MRKIIFFYSITFAIMCNSCSQNNSLNPGYRWDLFKNTPNWELAKAVAKEDTASIINIIKSGKVDVNLREPKFGRTLLMLAIGNDKLQSTSTLLKMGSDVNIRDNRDDQAIHESVAYIDLRKNSLETLRLLLMYHADPNSVSAKGSISVPLQGAVENFSCAKLLLDYGANPYFKIDNTFKVWFNSLIMDLPYDETIYVLKYIIIDKKMPIPNPIYFIKADSTPIDIYTLLNKYNVSNDLRKQQVRDSIIQYLHKIDFPNHGVYLDTIKNNK